MASGGKKYKLFQSRECIAVFLILFKSKKMKKLIITDQTRITNIPDLTSLSKLEEVYFLCNKNPNLKNCFNKKVKIYTWYNPCDVE